MPPYAAVLYGIAPAITEKSSADLTGRPRNNIAELREKVSSANSMHFAVRSASEEQFGFLTAIPSGNESVGSPRNSGKSEPEEPGRNCLPLSLDLNFVTSSCFASGSKKLDKLLLNVGGETWELVLNLGPLK